MFVGHAALAFALAAAAASLAGADRDRALAVGGVAGAFATVPDVDMVYALAGVLRVGLVGLWSAVDAFWSTGNVVHRSVTHSFVLGVPVAVAAALATTRRGRPLAAGLLAALVVWVTVEGSTLAGFVAAAAFTAAAAVAVLAAGLFDLDPREVLAAAAVGLLSHPPGDLFTGEPPAMLYPLDASLVSARVTLHPDPTLHLLAAFGVELATIWLAAAVYVRLRGGSLVGALDRRAVLGAGYGGAVLVVPAPTLEVSYPFVLTVLAVGAVGVLAGRRPWTVPGDRLRAALTGLAAVTIAAGTYATLYVSLAA